MKDGSDRGWVTRMTRKAERTFFFYATVVMFILYLYALLAGE